MSIPLNRKPEWPEIRKACETESAAEVARRYDIPSSTLRSALYAAVAEETSEDEPGYVYCLSNPCYSMVKIGRSFDTPEVRAQQLSGSSGVPDAFVVEMSLYTQRSHAVERALHMALNKQRTNHSREFFDVSVEQMRLLFNCLDEGAPEK